MISNAVVMKLFILLGAMLVSSLFLGLGMFRAYEMFQKGVRLNKKIYIWWAFVTLSFLLLCIAIFFGGWR